MSNTAADDSTLAPPGRTETEATWSWPMKAALAGLVLSSLGDEIAVIALALKMMGTGTSMFGVGALMAAGLVPAIILPPYTARLIQRFASSHILVAALLAQAAIVASAGTTGSLPLLIAFVTLLGALGSVVLTTTLTIVPRVVPEADLLHANQAIEVGKNIGFVAGPSLATALVSIGGTGLVLGIDAATFLLEALALLPLTRRLGSPQPETRGAETVKATWLRRNTAGVAELFADTRRQAVLSPIMVSVAAASMLNVVLVFYVRDHVGTGRSAYGPVVSALSAGLVLGPLVCGRLLKNRDHGRAAMLAAAGIGAAMAVIGLLADPVAVAAVTFAFGCANGMQNLNLTTFIMRSMDEAQRARLTAAYVGCLQFSVLIGFSTASAFPSAFSPQILCIGGLVSAAACTIGLARYRRIATGPTPV